MTNASREPDEGPYDFGVYVRDGWHTAVVVSGELDLATVQRFESACASIAFSSVARVELDLRELEFMDATGLRAVLRLHAICLSESTQLLIRPGPRAVQRVFELTGAHRLLPFEDVDHAD
jgi:anti-anti-sigma factor